MRRREGWRIGLLVVVGVLAAVAGWWYPTVPAEVEGEPELIAPDEAICRERREAREWVTAVIPEDAEEITVGRVGDKLQTKTDWLCRANEWLGDGCADTLVSPGDTLAVPLDDDGVDDALAARRPQETPPR